MEERQNNQKLELENTELKVKIQEIQSTYEQHGYDSYTMNHQNDDVIYLEYEIIT